MDKCLLLAIVIYLVSLTAAQGFGYYSIPLCFPHGYLNAQIPPRGACYQAGFPGSLPPSISPCLPPILYNEIMPPCEGQFYLLTTQTYGNLPNYNNYNQYSNIISNGYAHLRMCFPHDCSNLNLPPGSCYQRGFPGSIPPSEGTCLPPIIQDNIVAPCDGTYFSLKKMNYYEYRGFTEEPFY